MQEGLPEGATELTAQPAGLTGLVALTRRHDPDVLALQEVDFDRNGRSAVLEALCRKTRLRHARSHVLSDSSFFAGRRAGVAVVSRLPLTGSTAFRTPNPGLRATMNGRPITSHDKGALACGVDLGGGKRLRVVSLHMLPFHVFRKKPDAAEFLPIWDALATWLTGVTAAGPVLVGGDFNTDRRDLADPACRFRRVVKDVATHHGFASDDILFPDPMTLIAHAVEPSFSDHRLCLAELKVG